MAWRDDSVYRMGRAARIFIIVERIGFKKILDKIGFLRYVYTGLVVLFGWVIFRVANLHPALQYIRRMLTPWQYTQSTYALRELIGNRCIVMAVVGVLGMGLLQVGIKRFCPTAEKLNCKKQNCMMHNGFLALPPCQNYRQQVLSHSN